MRNLLRISCSFEIILLRLLCSCRFPRQPFVCVQTVPTTCPQSTHVFHTQTTDPHAFPCLFYPLFVRSSVLSPASLALSLCEKLCLADKPPSVWAVETEFKPGVGRSVCSTGHERRVFFGGRIQGQENQSRLLSYGGGFVAWKTMMRRRDWRGKEGGVGGGLAWIAGGGGNWS